jgi:5'-nucleotidase
VRSLSWLITLLICLVAVGGAPSHSAPAEVIPASRAGAPLTILQINDVYTIRTVDGTTPGGLARVASLKKQLASPGKTVLLLLAGDFLSPSVASSVFKGQQMVATLNAAGLDMATLGNHEFDFGPEVLRERMKEAKWQWVISNVLDASTGQPVGGAAPYLIRRYGSLTVGFLGLCLTGDEISPSNRVGLKMLDPIQTAARYVPLLKRQGATVIVAITHLNYPDDRRLATRFPDIDLIIGGHEHVPITATVNRTLISKAGMNARFVARIDVAPSGQRLALGAWRLARPKQVPIPPSAKRQAPSAASEARLERFFELIPMTNALPQDPATAAVVAEYEARLGTALDEVVGTTRVPLNADTESVRSAESNLGDMIADVMRASVQADLAILNSGTIRSGRVYPPGPLTRRDLVAILPFGDVTCKVAVSGAVVLAALNNGVSVLGQGEGRFPQVSGITLTVDPSAPPGEPTGRPPGRVPGWRVQDVRVNGQPLDPRKQYTVALTDYALGGGDGYTMFKSGKVLVSPETGGLLLTQVEAYVRRKGEIAPQVDGRLRMLPARASGRGFRDLRPVSIGSRTGTEKESHACGARCLGKAPRLRCCSWRARRERVASNHKGSLASGSGSTTSSSSTWRTGASTACSGSSPAPTASPMPARRSARWTKTASPMRHCPRRSTTT